MAEKRCRNIVPGLEFVGILGRGCFGVVYLVKNEAGEQFAVKHVDLHEGGSKNEKWDPEKERDLLRALSHKHVLMYVDSHVVEGSLYVITEYCQGGDMEQFLKNSGRPVPEDLLACWLHQMARGLEYMHCHDPAVLHRDLKPGNIYLTGAGDIRLGDLGIARELDQESDFATTVCGTPSYMSPELLLYKPYTAKTDIWSLGCCVVMMATLKKAFDDSSLYKIICAIVHNDRQPLPSGYSRELDSLVDQMLQKDPHLRPSASQICDGLQHKRLWPIEKKPNDLLASHDLLKALRQPPKTQQLSDDEVQTKYFSLTQSFSVVGKIMMDETDGFHDRVRARSSRDGAGNRNRSTQSTRKTFKSGQDDTDKTLLSLSAVSLSDDQTFLDYGTTNSKSLAQKPAFTSSTKEPAEGSMLWEETFVDHGTEVISACSPVPSPPVSLSMVWLDHPDGETKPGRQKSMISSTNLPASLSTTRGQPFKDHATTSQHQAKKWSEKTLLSLSKSSDENSNPAQHQKMTPVTSPRLQWSDGAPSHETTEPAQNQAMKSSVRSLLSRACDETSLDHVTTLPTKHQTIKLSMESPPSTSYQGAPKPAKHQTITLSMKSDMLKTSGETLDRPSTTNSAQHRTLKLSEKSPLSTSSDEALRQGAASPAQHRTIKISIKSPLSTLSDEALDRGRAKPAQYQTIKVSTNSPRLLKSFGEADEQHGKAKPAQSTQLSSTIARFSLSKSSGETLDHDSAESVQFYHTSESPQTTTTTTTTTIITPAQKAQTTTPLRATSSPVRGQLVDRVSANPPENQALTSTTSGTSERLSLLRILVSTVTSSVRSPGSEQTVEAEQLSYVTPDSPAQQMEQLRKSLEHALRHTSCALDAKAILDLLTASQNPYTALMQLKTMLEDR